MQFQLNRTKNMGNSCQITNSILLVFYYIAHASHSPKPPSESQSIKLCLLHEFRGINYPNKMLLFQHTTILTYLQRAVWLGNHRRARRSYFCRYLAIRDQFPIDPNQRKYFYPLQPKSRTQISYAWIVEESMDWFLRPINSSYELHKELYKVNSKKNHLFSYFEKCVFFLYISISLGLIFPDKSSNIA